MRHKHQLFDRFDVYRVAGLARVDARIAARFMRDPRPANSPRPGAAAERERVLAAAAACGVPLPNPETLSH